MMNETGEITEDDFEHQYNPEQVDYEEARRSPVERVWTIVEGDDGNLYAAPGYRVVNRLGYVVTERPWPSADVIAVWCDFEDMN